MDTQLLAGLLIFRIALHPQIHLVFHHPRRKRRRDADALLDLRFLAQNVGVLDIEKHGDFHARCRVELVDHQISHPCRRFPVNAVHRVFFPVIADAGKFKRILVQTVSRQNHARHSTADHLDPCSIDLARVNVHLCLLRVIAVKTLPEKEIVRYGMRTGDLVESSFFRLKRQCSRDLLMKQERKDIAFVALVGDARVCFCLAVKFQIAAHRNAKFQRRDRQQFVVYDDLF